MATNKIDVGDRAPDFTLPNAAGEPVRLYNLLEARPVVLYFYPKDDTPGCTAEACAFRDQYEQFTDAGASVVGISGDSPASHQAFAQKHKLPFVLLSDENNEVRKRYGVPTTMGFLPGRVTYVIDRQGTVRMAFNSQFKARQHVSRALDALREAMSADGEATAPPAD